MTLFGTSGIRGVYGKDVTPQLAMKVGNAVGSNSKKLILATDTRPTSPILADALAAGAMLSGCEVIDIGIAPTPMLAYVTHMEKCIGAMITASHNPPEYNGIKLFSKGMEFAKAQEHEVEKLLSENKEKKAEWNMAGQKETRNYEAEYIAFLLSKVNASAIKKRHPRVLVDAGNAAAYSIAPKLFEAAGCEVVRLYCDSPGDFKRNLEPKSSTLADAAKKVAEGKCDFGVAFDGDGDRAIAIDEKGTVLPLDVQLAMFAKHALAKTSNKKIVTTVEASLCVREIVEEHGGRLFVTPVGSLNVADEVLKEKAAFGGEPCGEYVFPFATPCAEGLLSALVAAEIFCSGGKLSSAASGIKTHFMERAKYKCREEAKQEIMRKLSEKPQLEGKLSTIDGLRYDFSDGWLLIRPSGTEPAIRLTCEAKSKKKLDEIVQRAEKMIMEEIHKTH
ncbi:MAG: phosphoglucosamine mutase [Candidatus Anstonellaceae archaeon]